jgi:hypothetical protein
MSTVPVTRATFAAAIAAGIDNAPGLTPTERDALLSVSRTAKRVGGNFDTGCPATRAKIIPRDYGTNMNGPTHHAAEDFADAYDGAMCNALPGQYARARYVRIID